MGVAFNFSRTVCTQEDNWNPLQRYPRSATVKCTGLFQGGGRGRGRFCSPWDKFAPPLLEIGFPYIYLIWGSPLGFVFAPPPWSLLLIVFAPSWATSWNTNPAQYTYCQWWTSCLDGSMAIHTYSLSCKEAITVTLVYRKFARKRGRRRWPANDTKILERSVFSENQKTP
jgi:hypothetical protein